MDSFWMRETEERIGELTARSETARRVKPIAKRLATAPGVGALTASAIAATLSEVDNDCSVRHYPTCLGLTPQRHSSGGRELLRRISKAGNQYPNQRPCLCASCLRHDGTDRRPAPRPTW